MLAAVDRARKVSLDRFIYSLGIRLIGQTTARLLAQTYRTYPVLEEAMQVASSEESDAHKILVGIDGIGLLTLNALLDKDYSIIMGFLVIGVIIRLVGNIISDLTYALIDPRIRFK